jgi:uncharacterized protein
MAANFDRAKQYVLWRLERELNPLLSYHSLWHTQGDVVPAAENLARLEGVEGEDLLLLMTAAWYHDVGFTVQRLDHEEAGVVIAKRALPDFDYTPGQIEVISGLIMATKLPQTPLSPLEEMMSDSDLDSLGRDDFLKTSLLLKAELAAFGINRTYPEWYFGQKNFLSGHQYFRAATRKLRNPGKSRNIQFLDQVLAAWEKAT